MRKSCNKNQCILYKSDNQSSAKVAETGAQNNDFDQLTKKYDKILSGCLWELNISRLFAVILSSYDSHLFWYQAEVRTFCSLSNLYAICESPKYRNFLFHVSHLIPHASRLSPHISHLSPHLPLSSSPPNILSLSLSVSQSLSPSVS